MNWNLFLELGNIVFQNQTYNTMRTLILSANNYKCNPSEKNNCISHVLSMYCLISDWLYIWYPNIWLLFKALRLTLECVEYPDMLFLNLGTLSITTVTWMYIQRSIHPLSMPIRHKEWPHSTSKPVQPILLIALLLIKDNLSIQCLILMVFSRQLFLPILLQIIHT
jgi:hypothetical protein